MFERVTPLHQAIENPTKGQPMCLSAIAGMAAAVHEIYQRELLKHGGEPMTRTANQFKSQFIGKNKHSALRANLRDDSVLTYTEEATRAGLTVPQFVHAFVQAAAIQFRHMHRTCFERKLVTGQTQFTGIAVPGPLEQKNGYHIGVNTSFLAENSALNYLRLIGAAPEISYDELHQRQMYLFTNATQPTQFAHKVSGYRNGPDNEVNLIDGKEMLELGAGNGADTNFFLERGAASVTIVDGSQMINDRLRNRFGDGPDSKVKLPAGGEALDMHDAFRNFESRGESFDTVSAHSCMHYFDDPAFLKLVEKVHGSLKQGGHFAFAVKAPGATFDLPGNGILLYDHSSKLRSDDRDAVDHGDHVEGRMWLNLDGQMRTFRSESAWTRLIEKDDLFTVVDRSVSQVDNYEAPGKSQTFYNFTCQRKEVPVIPQS